MNISNFNKNIFSLAGTYKPLITWYLHIVA